MWALAGLPTLHDCLLSSQSQPCMLPHIRCCTSSANDTSEPAMGRGRQEVPRRSRLLPYGRALLRCSLYARPSGGGAAQSFPDRVPLSS